MRETLFSRLVSYSQNPLKQDIENFTTELLAHLFNSSVLFRRRFLMVIILSNRERQRFMRAKAMTQQSIGNGRVDIILKNDADQKLLIEVKISAPETITEDDRGRPISQIRKYLAAQTGSVVFLTTKNTPTPEFNSIDGKRFRHVYFEDLYAKLKQCRLSEIGTLFVQFMGEKGMAPIESFNEKEIRVSNEALKFFQRAAAILNEVRIKITPDFQKIFGSKKTFTTARFGYDGVVSYVEHVGRRKNVEVGFKIGPEDGNLYFFVYVGAGKVGNLDLRKKLPAWELSGGYFWLPIMLRGNGRDNARMITHATKSLRLITNAIG